MATRKRSNYIPTLDGWRAIAIVLVILAHCRPMFIRSGTHAGVLLASVVEHAGYGVDIFFSLSGFLICTLLLQEKRLEGTIDLKRFYIRRCFRILPPIAVYLAALVVLSECKILPDITALDLAHTLLFVRNYFFGSWYTGHFWSLSIEEQFYFVIPLVLLMFSKRQALRFALFLIAVSVVTRWVELSHMTFSEGVPQFRTENRIDGLLWGGVLALLLQHERVKTQFTRRVTTPLVVAVGAVALLLLICFPDQAIRRTVVAIVMPLLIAHTVLHPHAVASKVLEIPWIRWVGRLSYSLYIWQMLFLPEVGRPLGVLQTFPIALLAALACATLSYLYVEKPMIRMGHRLAGTRARADEGSFNLPV
jgi:peptidoglycan/LPS O-acetylase OafA/YrhL